MRNGLRQTLVALIAFWLIFVVSLATCLAGISACPPTCFDCSALPTCCVGMDGKAMSGTGGSADHLPGPSACDHGRICADCLPPSNVGAVYGSVQNDLAPSLFEQIFSVQTEHYDRVIASVFHEFLQNCSFLI